MTDHETCGSKRRYWTKVDALVQMEIAMNRFDSPMRVYRCPTCKGWHLSKKRRRAAPVNTMTDKAEL